MKIIGKDIEVELKDILDEIRYPGLNQTSFKVDVDSRWFGFGYDICRDCIFEGDCHICSIGIELNIDLGTNPIYICKD